MTATLSRSPTGVTDSCRSHRVIMLLGLVLALSIGDLFMTLTHLTQAGMFESNPIASAIITLDSPALLIAWKLLTVSCALSILFMVRDRLTGELATWLGVLLLTFVTVRWITYSDAILEGVPALAMLEDAAFETSWARLSN